MRVEKLINLTGSDEFVEVDGKRVKLPSGPRPVMIDRSDRPEEVLEIAELGAVLAVPQGEPAGVLFMPEPSEGVAFLVSAELVARFPHRDDLFCAEGFEIDLDDEELPSVLVSVSAQLPPVGPEVELIQLDDFDQNSQEAEAGPPAG